MKNKRYVLLIIALLGFLWSPFLFSKMLIPVSRSISESVMFFGAGMFVIAVSSIFLNEFLESTLLTGVKE